jgi:uncharacterized membrane protein YesL
LGTLIGAITFGRFPARHMLMAQVLALPQPFNTIPVSIEV